MSSVAAAFKQDNAYLRVVSTIPGVNFLTYTPGTGSGGAFVPGSFATFAWGTSDTLSTNLQAGQTLKDMGKTVVSSGRVFRKVQLMGAAANPGVSGGSVIGPSFGTGYLEVASDAGDTANCLA
jgi:hypothetical protein